jgi:hypothetical protein
LLGKQKLLSREDVKKLVDARVSYYGSASGAVPSGEEPVVSDDAAASKQSSTAQSAAQEEIRRLLEGAIRKLKDWRSS